MSSAFKRWIAACAVFAAVGPSAGASAHQGHPDTTKHAHDPLALIARAPVRPLGPGSWPMYGRDERNSRDGAGSGPSVAGVRRLGAVWSFEASNRGITGTPIVGGGTVVVASALGTLFALDAARGRLRWSHDFGEQIYGSAAIVGQRVYVPVSGARGTPSVVALRLRDGKVLWRTVLETTSGSDLYASPVVAEGTLYIGTSAGLGEHFDPDVHVRNSVVALDARTGAQRWKTYTVPPGYDGGAVVTTAAVDTANHRLFVGTGNAYHEPAADTTDAMLSLDTRTGRILRHFQATRRDIYTHHRVDPGPDLDFGASPNLFAAPDGRLLVGELQKSRVYWTLDSRTMNRVWSRRMSTTAGHPFLDTLSSTAYDGRRIYGQSDDGQVMALNPSGTRRWVTPPSGSANYSPVAVADGVVYSIRSEGSLIARRAGTGAILRRIPLGSPSWGGVAVAGGSVFVATGTDSTVNGYVVAYRPRT